MSDPATDNAIDASGLEAMLARGAAERIFSGAVLHVRREGDVLLDLAVGRTERDAGDAVTPATFFDLASVTKIFATTSMRSSARCRDWTPPTRESSFADGDTRSRPRDG